ncbi:hypothetical protein AL532_00030 (plasmid) [Pseudomonas monteilii]|uniref:DUF4214 domain-containing protein n=1 Tax=Pseudomonas monteilii TaxID=76759 RepID=UPI000CEB6598|nr:DUF4214 domain-containing protein [Pseudomonas monteilii]AVH34844.1 hypothetical protein AL532_00030 [Pseudomonas monteilii]
MATTSTQVQQLYVAYLGRAADKGGLDYWMSQLNSDPAKITLDQIRTNFVNEQPEYKEVYGGLSRIDTVTKIYNNLFGRAPDAGGLEYWTTGGGANVGLDDLLVAFINGAAPADATTITNKVLISELYTAAAGTDGYLAADAKTIISGVKDNASLAAQLVKLTDGSLSGIALTSATVNLKASVAADAAVTGYEANNVTSLKSVETQLKSVTEANTLLADYTPTAASVSTYGGVDTALSGALTTLRGNLGTEASLTTAANTAATNLTTAADALRTTDADSVTKTTAYAAAYAADKAAVGAASGAEEADVATLAAYGSLTANATVWGNALAAAGITAATGGTAFENAQVDAQALYDFLSANATTAAQVTAVSKVFTDANVSQFTAFAADAALDKADAKAAADLATAAGALTGTEGNNWKSAYAADATAKANLEASKALTTVENAYKAIDTAHDALVTAQSTAAGNLDANAAGVATGTAITFTGDANADVFYFPTTKTFQGAAGQDGAVTLAANGDKLYIGEGYTLKSSATLTATGITGADNNALEVFFLKDASGAVKAVIENNVAGSVGVTSDALASAPSDGVSIITLTGVTDVSQVTFANGVISHV